MGMVRWRGGAVVGTVGGEDSDEEGGVEGSREEEERERLPPPRAVAVNMWARASTYP